MRWDEASINLRPGENGLKDSIFTQKRKKTKNKIIILKTQFVKCRTKE
jgi:hypothetical protein